MCLLLSISLRDTNVCVTISIMFACISFKLQFHMITGKTSKEGIRWLILHLIHRGLRGPTTSPPGQGIIGDKHCCCLALTAKALSESWNGQCADILAGCMGQLAYRSMMNYDPRSLETYTSHAGQQDIIAAHMSTLNWFLKLPIYTCVSFQLDKNQKHKGPYVGYASVTNPMIWEKWPNNAMF